MNIINGDLFDYAARTQGPVIIHGCNCRGSFAAGFAGLIRNRFPEAYQSYSDDDAKGILRPGFVRYVPINNDNGTIVANACTQLNPGACAKLEYIDECVRQIIKDLTAVAAIMDRRGKKGWDKQVFLPAIGCGIGGLELKDVQPVLERLDELNVLGFTINLVLL